ncbi:zinc finger MYM-type protein 1 [Trichonephila clavipes]|nr:zinc finger MYM-type protein 1 [Trichonephila clavipes]
MSKSVIEEIIHIVKQTKYYAFLLDCTRDVSRVEQMSIILRFCDSSTGAIEEHFVGFIAFTETTGEYITNSILQELERNGLDIQNYRGQEYDNGANMVGINKGVRTRILNINPTAFFTPCGCHHWNLLLIHAANSSATAKTFFGFINKSYVLFSKPSKRWDIVKTKLKLTLKPLSETRDHFPIITSINQKVDGIIQSKRTWNFRKANWGKFTPELETLCSLSSPHILDERLQFFASHINAAAKRSIPRVKRRKDWVPFWKDTNIENLIKERDKLSTELQKNNTETNRIRFTNLCHKVEEAISSCKCKKWTEFCETLDPQKISQHWKVIKTLNIINQHTKNQTFLLTSYPLEEMQPQIRKLLPC